MQLVQLSFLERERELRMGRSPCCPKEGMNRGAWSAFEDKALTDYIKAHGEGKWRNIPKEAGLKRCGKSCRLRWLNYLRPDIKRGNISQEEEDLIIRLHKLLGNRWSLIAGRLPGRTDNEIKNYWNTTLGKKAKSDQSKAEIQKQTKMRPSSVLQTNTVIRTKASRCTKSVCNPCPNKVENLGTNVAATEVSMDGDLVNNSSLLEHNSPNFTMNSNEGEYFLSYFSDSESWKLCDLFDNAEGLNRSVLFSEEMLKDWMRDDSFHY